MRRGNSHVFFFEGKKKHKKLKLELQNSFTTGNDKYPRKIQGTLMILDKYTKYIVRQHTNSEGMSFTQRAGSGNKHLPPYDKKNWKNLQCFRCLQRVQPASHCTKKFPIITVKE